MSDDLKKGDHVTWKSHGQEVEGTVKPDLMTTCQQGTPLVVHRIISS